VAQALPAGDSAHDAVHGTWQGLKVTGSLRPQGRRAVHGTWHSLKVTGSLRPQGRNTMGCVMFVALLRLELRLPDATSLKDKRAVLRSLSAHLRKLNCAVAEVDHQEQRQRATMAVATVSGEGFHARRVLVSAEREAERAAGIELLDAYVTLYGPEDG
jgi:hypothetical protein